MFVLPQVMLHLQRPVLPPVATTAAACAVRGLLRPVLWPARCGLLRPLLPPARCGDCCGLSCGLRAAATATACALRTMLRPVLWPASCGQCCGLLRPLLPPARCGQCCCLCRRPAASAAACALRLLSVFWPLAAARLSAHLSTVLSVLYVYAMTN